jgi:hypothetical protein
MKRKDAKGNWPSRSEATTAGAKSIKKTFPASNCSQKCLEAQLNAYHDSVAPDPEKPIKATHPMATNEKLSDEGRLTRDEAAQEMGVPQGSTR